MKENRKKKSKKTRRKNRIATVLVAIVCIAVVGAAALAAFCTKNNFGKKNLICNGVSIGDIDVGGMTEAEASEKVQDYVTSQLEKEVVVSVEENTVVTTAAAIGLSYPTENVVSEALAIGKDGSLWQRFQEFRQAYGGKKDIDFAAEMDQDTLKSFVEEQCSVFDVKAKNSTLKLKNGKIKATKSKTGLAVQVENTMQLLEDAVMSEDNETKDSISVTADVELTEPKYTQEEVSQCTDLLGKYSTTYSTYMVERSSNVALAASRINGTVLYPGKVFSTVKVIKDRTEENGYKAAPEYSSGKVVSGIGGGVCQVSTTLYNAVINAELEVVERAPHSMVVSYVPVSRDAAISGDYKDFKFKNNLDYPVYIMASASGGVLTFQIYGHETRDANRTISFEPEILETIQPGADVVTEDSSLPSGYRSVTQSAHVGYRAKLWKIISVDGVEQERVELNTSTYNASPQYVTVGRQAATPAPASTKEPESTEKSATGDTKKSETKATTKPETTKKDTTKDTTKKDTTKENKND